MAFYDSVKDDIRDETSAAAEDEGETMPFDQLKEEAEDREDPEESDTSTSDAEIEVLGDGDLAEDGEEESGAGSSGAATRSEAQTGQTASQGTGGTQQGETSGQAPSTDRPPQQTTTDAAAPESAGGDTEMVELLRRLEQQNQEMLDVLRGIKRSLE
ncbi:MAG: hypothetical protein SVW02_00345 [Candidatus Nanohaloarchaea archaeon]|nr:hypothetical protein [Candidatus Nanohaloarchaea archaeon]